MTLAQLNNTGFVRRGDWRLLDDQQPHQPRERHPRVWDVNGHAARRRCPWFGPGDPQRGRHLRRRLGGFTNVIDLGGSFRLTENAGDLTLSDGRNDLVQPAQHRPVTVAAGSSVTITSSASRSTDTLLEGIWNVQGSPSGPPA